MINRFKAVMEAIRNKQLDEAQFIVLQKAGKRKRIRNNPEEIARAKEDGWVVLMTEAALDEISVNKMKDYIHKSLDSGADLNFKAGQKLSAQRSGKNTESGIVDLHKAMARKDGQALAAKKIGVKTGKTPHTASGEQLAYYSASSNHGAEVGKNGKHQQHYADLAKEKKSAAHKKVDEATEKLDELSKKTLGSYVQAAALNISHRGRESGAMIANRYIYKTKDMQDYAQDRKDKAEKNINKRYKGIDSAVKRLTKEDMNSMSKEDVLNIFKEEFVRRGRPPKAKAGSSDDGEREHIMMALRKSISLKGDHPVSFSDGSTHKIGADHAGQILRKHDSMEKPSHKMAFAMKVGASHDSLKSELGAKKGISSQRRSRDT